MRILHVNGRYFAVGGAETYLKALADAQRCTGHEVHFLYASDPPIYPPQEQQIHFAVPSYGLRSGLRHRRAFVKLVRGLRPDVIHCHVIQYSVSPLLLTALAQSYVTVYSVHDTLAFCLKEPAESPEIPLLRMLPSGAPCLDPVGRPCMHHGCHRQLFTTSGLVGSIKRFAEVSWRLRALRRLGRFIVNSRFSREELLRNGFSPDRIDVIAPPLAMPETWDRQQARTARTAPTVLYVGYLAPIKGVFALLEALAKIRHLPWRAELVGEGPARSGLEKKVSSLGLAGRVFFEGQVERERLAEFYRDADLLVFPSFAPESWGLVGTEAMYFGLPVVGFDVGATREWLAHGETGLLVPTGDVDKLANALARLLGDAALRERLGEEARRRVPRFLGRQAAFAQRIERVYLQAMADRQGGNEDRN